MSCYVQLSENTLSYYWGREKLLITLSTKSSLNSEYSATILITVLVLTLCSMTMDRVLFPRLHLAEVEDQSWCPSWLREHSHKALVRTWRVSLSNRGSPAVQASKILVDQLGGIKNATKYTFIDVCAGSGGPTPLIEQRVNEQLRSAGLDCVRFVLTDLWPDIKAWKGIASRSENISYIEQPIDAIKGVRLSGPEGKECRMFNLSFHHFDDPAAEKVLASAVESADAFV